MEKQNREYSQDKFLMSTMSNTESNLLKINILIFLK